MKVNSLYEFVSSQELPPARLVQVSEKGRGVLAMTATWKTGERCCIVLEGETKGTLIWDLPNSIFAVKEPFAIELPHQSASWLGKNKPSTPLSIATDGTRTYFAFMNQQVAYVADIESGVIGGLPYQAHYISDWEIWPEGAKPIAPILSSDSD